MNVVEANKIQEKICSKVENILNISNANLVSALCQWDCELEEYLANKLKKSSKIMMVCLCLVAMYATIFVSQS